MKLPVVFLNYLLICFLCVCVVLFLFFVVFWFFLRERNIYLLTHLPMHSLVDSCLYPDRGSKPQTLVYEDNALTTELPAPPIFVCLFESSPKE